MIIAMAVHNQNHKPHDTLHMTKMAHERNFNLEACDIAIAKKTKQNKRRR
jgi:hypothetical protein